MYSFIYFFMAKLAEKRNPESKFYAAQFVVINQIVHLLLIFAIIKKYYYENLHFGFSEVYVYNKLCWVPIGFLWFLLAHFYYKKRYAKLQRKFSDEGVLTLKNGIIVFTILFIPLIMMIILLKK